MKKFLTGALIALGSLGLFSDVNAGVSITSGGSSGGPNTSTVNPGSSITSTLNNTPPRITIAGMHNTASTVAELSDSDLGQRVLTPTEGVTFSQVCVEADRLGEVTGNITLAFETSAAAAGLDRAAQTTYCTSEPVSVNGFAQTTNEPVTRSNYDTVCFKYASACTLPGDTLVWAAFIGDAVYKTGSTGCTADNDPDVCCTSAGVGLACQGFVTGTDTVRFVDVGDNLAPCATWTYSDGTKPGTHATNCQRAIQTGDNWASLVNRDIAMVVGDPSVIVVNPGLYRENVKWVQRGSIHLVGSPGTIIYPEDEDAANFRESDYAIAVQRALFSSISNITLINDAQPGDWSIPDLSTMNTAQTTGIHVEGSSDFLVRGTRIIGFPCGFDGAICGGITANGEYNRAITLEDNTIQSSFVGAANRTNDFGRFITRDNKIRTDVGAGTSTESTFVGLACGGGNAAADTDAICEFNGDSVELNVSVTPDYVTMAAIMVAPDFNGYAYLNHIHSKIKSEGTAANANNVYALNVGDIGGATGGQASGVTNVVGGSYYAYNENGGAGSSAVSIICTDCNELNVYNTYLEAIDTAGTAATLAIQTGGALKARNITGDSSKFIRVAGTLVVSPTFGSGLADAATPTDITVKGVGTTHACSCSSNVVACNVTSAHPKAVDTVEVDWVGCTNGVDTIACQCSLMP